MAKKFRDLVAKMSPEAQREIKERTEKLLAEIPLNQVRHARGLTQAQIAEEMGISQASVSKIEGQADMYLSTLSRFIEASGGKLRIIAQFPDGAVEVKRLTDVG